MIATKGGVRGMALLAGRPREGRVDDGPLVCSCFSVGRSTIAATAAAVAEVGVRLSAGANCGSCKSEIAALIAARRPVGAALPA